MATISFKAEDRFKAKLQAVADKKGINTSSYIKLVLTKEIDDELSAITPNGLTVAQELAILRSDKSSKTFGPFSDADELLSNLEG